MDKRNRGFQTSLLMIVICSIFLAACRLDTPSADLVEGPFNGERALALVREQLAFGFRTPGSEAHRLMGDWMIQELEGSGWVVEEQFFPYRDFQGRNIIAKGGPSEGEWIVLGAHYDTRPIADQDESDPMNPVPGANDGGSGVAVLLELARVLQKDAFSGPLWLVFFDLEDSGSIDGMEWIVGSSHFAQNLEDLPDKVIIVDMVGDKDLQIYYEMNSDPVLQAEIWEVAADLGFTEFIPAAKHSMIDDHTPFVRLGIPAVDIIDFDYPYWHTTEDTLDKVSSQSLEKVGQTLQTWLFPN